MIQVKLIDTGVSIDGTIEDFQLREILEEAESAGQPLDETFLELLKLGTQVKEVITTSATSLVLANAVEKVQGGLSNLESDHRGFLLDLMDKILGKDSSSDLNLIKGLSDWRQDFDKKLADEFSDEINTNTLSKIRASIDKNLEARDVALASLFSLEEASDAFANRPLKTVADKVQAILDKLNEEKGKKSEGRKRSKTGMTFEGAVYSATQEIADELGDIADDTGARKVNGVDGNDEGDIVVEFALSALTGATGKLVIECKKSEKTVSKRALLAELDKGISNREADYGILVTNASGYNMTSDFPFWEDLGNRRSILVVDDDFENIDENKMRFAYLVAKARVKDLKANPDLDTLSDVQPQISTLADAIGRLTHLRGAHSDAVSALGTMLSHIDFLDTNVSVGLKKLDEKLKKSLDQE
jgi:CHASE3 domain sensor protein